MGKFGSSFSGVITDPATKGFIPRGEMVFRESALSLTFEAPRSRVRGSVFDGFMQDFPVAEENYGLVRGKLVVR